ncbi:MAG: hypothetical protein QNJ47_21580 [Nostocaceae cyanobacterium]|nr:hypothetical protein [Nostocaceae cyanobacterium]
MKSNINICLQDANPYEIFKFKEIPNATVPGYFVISTAAINVDDEKKNNDTNYSPSPIDTNLFYLNDEQDGNSAEHIIENEIVQDLKKCLQANKQPEIIINIHGYSATQSDIEKEYKKIYQYINQNIHESNQYIFIGYRWPAENPIKKNKSGDESGSFVDKLFNAFSSLPKLPTRILAGGLTISILSTLFLWHLYLPLPLFMHIAISLLIVSGFASSVILTLIILRISTYFRDVYRATNYGVNDLVELLRTIDYYLLPKSELDDKNPREELDDKQRIKLSFIGHSLGCFLITNVIRILSDIFDPLSVQKTPDSKIGKVFSLGRLVLVAPDIPVETILPGRGNFLRSCLRRCEEAYIFSNEADLPLRFTSTAANYFSFPAKTRISGYRLGNITVSHFNDQYDTIGHPPKYGIVNYNPSDKTQGKIIDKPYEYLEIRSSNTEHRKLVNLAKMRDISENDLEPPANLFTYFDCTDYKDDKSKNIGLLSHALQKPAINLPDYISLIFAFIRKLINPDDPQGIDTHNAYFLEGTFIQHAIYKLGFLGFDKYLQSLSIYGTKEEQIQAFSQECENKQIQTLLAPKLYKNK